MDFLDKLEDESKLPFHLRLSRIMLITAVGLIAKEVAGRAFDKIIENRQDETTEEI